MSTTKQIIDSVSVPQDQAGAIIGSLAEDTRDCWVVKGPSGVSKRVYGVKSADEAIAKYAARCSYKTLAKAKEAGVTAKCEKGMTQDQQGKANAAKHSKWFNSKRGGSSVFRKSGVSESPMDQDPAVSRDPSAGPLSSGQHVDMLITKLGKKNIPTR